MAIVIHTRKGKYQYAYEHTREGDKVVSRYMYPVNQEGDQIEPYQREVAQQNKQYTVIKEYKKKIQNKSIEYFAVIDKYGNMVINIKGSKKGTDISLSQSELAQIPEGCITIHNHPKDLSFSKDDIRSTYLLRAKKSIIVTPSKYKKEYILSRVDKKSFDPAMYKKISDDYDIAYNKVISECKNKIKKGEMTVKEAIKITPHLTMIELVHKNKQLKYEVIKK